MPSSESKRTVIRVLSGVGAVAVLYVGLAWWTSRDVPSSMAVEGVQIGGLSVDQAAAKLTAELGPKATAPITVTVPDSDKSFTVDPAAAGLALDIPGSLTGLGEFSLNPADIWAHLTGKGERAVTRKVDEAALTSVVKDKAQTVASAPVDGAIAIEAGAAKVTQAKDGREVVVPDTVAAITQGWLKTTSVPAKTTLTAPKVTQAAVDEAMKSFVTPALSAPVTLAIADKTLPIAPERFAAAMTLSVQDGKIVGSFDKDKLAAIVTETTAPLISPGKDAQIVLQGSAPVIKPSVDGIAVDTTTAGDKMMTAVTSADRKVELPTKVSKPKFTTEAAQALGVKEVVASFDSAFPTDTNRTINLTIASNTINGTLIKPGETFSMNGILGERTTAKGYREGNYIAGGGMLAKTVGGGVSQVSTVIYNISWFAGAELIEHHPHSFYISRYPAGREATVNWPTLDNRWRNNTQYGMLVQMWVSGGQVHGRIWSTKIYDVESISGPRTNIRKGTTVTSTAPGCVPMGTADGFDIVVTRVIRQNGAVVKTENYKTSYDAANQVICAKAP